MSNNYCYTSIHRSEGKHGHSRMSDSDEVFEKTTPDAIQHSARPSAPWVNDRTPFSCSALGRSPAQVEDAVGTTRSEPKMVRRIPPGVDDGDISHTPERDVDELKTFVCQHANESYLEGRFEARVPRVSSVGETRSEMYNEQEGAACDCHWQRDYRRATTKAPPENMDPIRSPNARCRQEQLCATYDAWSEPSKEAMLISKSERLRYFDQMISGFNSRSLSPDQESNISPMMSPRGDIRAASTRRDLYGISQRRDLEDLKSRRDIRAILLRRDLRDTAPRSDVDATSPRRDFRTTSPRHDLRDTTPRIDVYPTSPRRDLRPTSPRPDIRDTSPRRDLRHISLQRDLHATSLQRDFDTASPGHHRRAKSPRKDALLLDRNAQLLRRDIQDTPPGRDIRSSSPRRDRDDILPRRDIRYMSPQREVRASPARRDLEEEMLIVTDAADRGAHRSDVGDDTRKRLSGEAKKQRNKRRYCRV